METASRQTRCPVSKILQRHIKEPWIVAKTYSALSFDRINFFQHGEFVFTFSESFCYVLLFSWANKNFLF